MEGRTERVRDCLTIGVLSILAALAIRPFQNAPFVDDWAYAWSVENLLERGRLEVLNYSDNVNVAQVLWGWLLCRPFGFSFTALRISTWLLAVTGLCGLYLLLRELEVSRRDAMLGTATLAVYPTFALLGATFMTDVPFVAVTILASLAMVKAWRQRSVPWLAAAALAASIGVGIRGVGVVTPVAMSLSLLAARDNWGRQRARWAIALAPLLVFLILMQWWRSHTFSSGDLTWVRGTTVQRIPMLRQFAIPLLPRMLGETLALVAGVVGLAVLPLSQASIRRETLKRTVLTFCALGAGLTWLYAIGLRYPMPLATGSVWSLYELGGTTELVPDDHAAAGPMALCVAALAIGGWSSAAAIAAVSRKRRWEPAELFLVWALIGHVGLMALIWLVFDRYALVLVPYVIAVVLVARPRLNRPVVLGILTVFALVTAAGITDHLSYSRALWQAVDALNRAGVPAREINGGYVVNGWRQYAHPDAAPRDSQGRVEVPWVNGAKDLPYKVANGVPEGWDELGRFRYERWLGASGYVYTLKLTRPAK